VPNPRGINQYSKGGGAGKAKRKGPPKMSGLVSDQFTRRRAATKAGSAAKDVSHKSRYVGNNSRRKIK